MYSPVVSTAFRRPRWPTTLFNHGGQRRHASARKFLNAENNPLSPYFVKGYLLFGFLGAMLYITVFQAKDVVNTPKKELSAEEKKVLAKQRDSRRPPWPLLHQRAVFMREGKVSHEDIGLLWEQTKYYYPHDWLIPLEIAQILKFSSGVYLSAYVADPEKLRKEVSLQLMNVKYGRIPNAQQHKINKDVEEIIGIAVDELESISLDITTSAPLVPVPPKNRVDR